MDGQEQAGTTQRRGGGGDIESAAARSSRDHTGAIRQRSPLFTRQTSFLHDSDGVSISSRLRVLRGILAFVVLAPAVGGGAVGALIFDHAPSYLMYWATLPVMALSIALLSVVTIVSQAPLDHFFNGIFWLWSLLQIVVHGPYLWRELAWFCGIGFVVWCVSTVACVYILFTRMRAALWCAQAGSLQEFLEGTFLVFAEFMVIASYGTASSFSCLLSVDVGDSRDVLDSTMWSTCGATVLSNICLGLLVVIFFATRLCVVDTGIAHLKDMLELNVPPGLKALALCVIFMGIVTLFFQAATSSRLNISVALGFFALFMVLFSTAATLLGFTASPKRAAKNHSEARRRSAVVAVAPHQQTSIDDGSSASRRQPNGGGAAHDASAHLATCGVRVVIVSAAGPLPEQVRAFELEAGGDLHTQIVRLVADSTTGALTGADSKQHAARTVG